MEAKESHSGYDMQNLKHPVLTGEYAIFTPPIDEMIRTIGDWIDQKVSGGYIYGPSRFGKTRAIKWFFRSILEERFGSILPIVVWIRPSTKINEGEFWNLMLGASKFEFFNPLKPKKKGQARYLFKQQMVTLAASTQNNFVVLVIDEAQGVSLDEWMWILGLQNELDDEGIRLSVFSIGSHQISFQPNYLARTGNAHIVARFFSVDMKFHGISSSSELEYVLRGYDEDSEWPHGSNTSYLKYFSPIEFSKNNRLTNHTADIWATYENLLPKDSGSGGKKSKLELPMLHIAKLIEQILNLLSQGKDWKNVMDPSNLPSMVEKTGFTNHMKAIRALC